MNVFITRMNLLLNILAMADFDHTRSLSLSFLSFFPVAAVPLLDAADFLEDDCSRERSFVGATSSSDELDDCCNIE